MKAFLIRWLVTVIAVAVATELISGIHADSVFSLILAALLLGIINAFVRPVLLLLSLPLILATMGIFFLIINALMLWGVSTIVHGFHVDGFGAAFWGALLISIVSWLLSIFFKGSNGRVHVLTHHTKFKNEKSQMKQARGRVIE